MQGSPRNLLGFKGAVGGSLFTAISHGRIGDVVQTSHALGKEIVQWRHLYVASDCLNPAKKKKTPTTKMPTVTLIIMIMLQCLLLCLLTEHAPMISEVYG